MNEVHTPPVLAELVRMQRESGERPVEALQAVAELRRWLDESEAELIAWARQPKHFHGWSGPRFEISAIAAALGVSLSAAHRRCQAAGRKPAPGSPRARAEL